MEYKIEFASTQFPDVDSSDGKAVCSTNLKNGLKSHFTLEFFQLGFFAWLHKLLISMQWSLTS